MKKKETYKIKGQETNREILKIAIDKDIPILLIGETGTGKTSIVEEIAEQEGQQLIRINLNGQTSVDEFVGKYLLKDKETIWIDGVLIQAMKNGWWILCDEINAALPEIHFVLHSLLDHDRMVLLAEKDGEIIRPAKTFRFFGTMNPYEEYSGTKDLNKAFLSRFGCVLNFNHPETDIERTILVERTSITMNEATLLVECATVIRKLKQEEDITYTISTRDLLYWASLVKDLGIATAFIATIYNKAPKDEKPILQKAISKTLDDLQEKLEAYVEKTGKSLVEDMQEKIEKLEEDKQEFEKEIKRLKSNTEESTLKL